MPLGQKINYYICLGQSSFRAPLPATAFEPCHTEKKYGAKMAPKWSHFHVRRMTPFGYYQTHKRKFQHFCLLTISDILNDVSLIRFPRSLSGKSFYGNMQWRIRPNTSEAYTMSSINLSNSYYIPVCCLFLYMHCFHKDLFQHDIAYFLRG